MLSRARPSMQVKAEQPRSPMKMAWTKHLGRLFFLLRDRQPKWIAVHHQLVFLLMDRPKMNQIGMFWKETNSQHPPMMTLLRLR